MHVLCTGPPGPPQGPSMPSILPTVPSAPPPPSLTASATIPAPPLGLQTPIGVGVGGDPLLAPAGGGVVAAGQSQAPLMSDPMGLGAAMGAPVAGIQPAAPFQVRACDMHYSWFLALKGMELLLLRQPAAHYPSRAPHSSLTL
eukprot:401003-Pelagomonas_calceolata.AAC.6